MLETFLETGYLTSRIGDGQALGPRAAEMVDPPAGRLVAEGPLQTNRCPQNQSKQETLPKLECRQLTSGGGSQ